MDRLFSALVLVPALASNACTVVADVDYRGAGDDSEAVDLDISGNVVFYREDYTDPGASYAGALDINIAPTCLGGRLTRALEYAVQSAVGQRELSALRRP